MEVYDYYKESDKKKMTNFIKRNIIIGIVFALVLITAVVAAKIYLDVIQLNEIGNNLSSIYLKNLQYQLVFAAISFVIIFGVISLTNIFIKRVIGKYLTQNNIPLKKLPNYSIAAIVAILGSFLTKDMFYQKALSFINSNTFGKVDPLLGNDIGYYVFQRPFLMSLYDFFFTLWLFVIAYTIAYYIIFLFTLYNNVTLDHLKYRSILRHNLINIAILFVIKTVSYKFAREGIIYSTFANTGSNINVNGAGYVDVNIWRNYFTIAPILLVIIVLFSFFFIWRSRLKKAAITIAVFPAVWIIVSIVAGVFQWAFVRTNEIDYEKEYLKYNMQQTQEAFKINNIKSQSLPNVQELTPSVIERNKETLGNIRVVDYNATLDSNKQLQSLRNFYTFQDGDIINYNVNGKETPVFITAREIDKAALQSKSYTNNMFKYTHGYGVVINPINRFTAQGQTDFIVSGLESNTTSSNLKVTQPRIYYGEMTNDYVIVNPPGSTKMKETDYDGNKETSYDGAGGIKLDAFKRLLFAMKNGDYNILVSGNISSESKILLNRGIVDRAQKAVPFLTVDTDPYIILTDDGRLKWILDAYTTTKYYPYSQNYSSFNYIRNSVKIVIDAYDGKVDYYVIDKDDPIIQTYSKMYPGIFNEGNLPKDLKNHMRYPEKLFNIQTEVMRKYHLDPMDEQSVTSFYGNQDLWNVASMPQRESNGETPIESFYNMIKLPGDHGTNTELILMRPFTPSGGRHNLVSWLSVRNDSDNYGELILYNFPKNADNIFGPYQVEVKINQIDSVSRDMTLWGQGGSEVFKGNLLVIPIENSVLYVEPIYIRSTAQAIPEVREIVVGYQVGNEFKYGTGTNLNSAINNLFAGGAKTQPIPGEPDGQASPSPSPTGLPSSTPIPNLNVTPGTQDELINEILNKYDSLKQQMDQLDKLMGELKNKK